MIEVYLYVSTGLCFDIHDRGGDQETEGEKKIECWSERMRESSLYKMRRKKYLSLVRFFCLLSFITFFILYAPANVIVHFCLFSACLLSVSLSVWLPLSWVSSGLFQVREDRACDSASFSTGNRNRLRNKWWKCRWLSEHTSTLQETNAISQQLNTTTSQQLRDISLPHSQPLCLSVSVTSALTHSQNVPHPDTHANIHKIHTHKHTLLELSRPACRLNSRFVSVILAMISF